MSDTIVAKELPEFDIWVVEFSRKGNISVKCFGEEYDKAKSFARRARENGYKTTIWNMMRV